MSSAEFTEWMAFARLEPFGPDRADWRAAMVASVIANANRDARKHPRPYRVEDFMPRFEPREKSPEEMLAYVEMLNTALGGRDLRQKGG